MFDSIFIVSWWVVIISLLVSILEGALAIKFFPLAYRIGIPVLRMTEAFPLDKSRIPPGLLMATTSGRVRFINSATCLFVPHHSWQLRPRIHTPFLIRGRIHWREGIAWVEGKISVATSLYLLAFLVGWTSGVLAGVLDSLQSAQLSAVQMAIFVGILLVGWAFVIGACLWGIPYESRRAQRIVDELRKYMLGDDSQLLPDADFSLDPF
jgi:hypothetical protein